MSDAGSTSPDVISVKGLTGTQKAGVWLAAGVGSVGALVTLAVVGKWMVARCPSISATMSQAEIDSVVKGCDALQEQIVTRGLQLFDSVIVKALLPVFTSILGYIFGAHHAGSTDASQAK